MRLPLLILLFQLWSNVKFSLSQNVCSKLPVVPHALVSDNTKRDEYPQGHTIHFTCETGYISGPLIRYICSNEGWQELTRTKCYLKPCQLPDETPNGYYQIIDGTDFVFGATVQYFCNEGYQMVSREDKRTCLTDKWTNHVPICEPLSCPLPPAGKDITISGLPDNDEPIHPDRFLTFSCDGPGKYLNGSSVLICGQDGKWNKPFPTCEEITCKVEVMHPKLSAEGLSPANKTVTVGQKLKFQCDVQYTLYGSAEIQCLETGQWSDLFPTCTDKCIITEVPQSVHIYSSASGHQLRAGQKIKFSCRIRSHILYGKDVVECLANGQWSHPFPTCGTPMDCGRPPTVTDADTRQSVKDNYRHNEQVAYACPPYYNMEGGPFKTCNNGEWVGEMRCLKPCTVDREAMSKRNIQFRYSRDDKIYSTHNDQIEFICTRGRRVGQVAMRQTCVEGVIHLPTCQ